MTTDILDSRLAALRAELNTLHAPPALESVLASQFRRAHGKRPALWWLPPRALLADWGLPVEPDRAGEPVRAELLYSADGEALAVRLIN